MFDEDLISKIRDGINNGFSIGMRGKDKLALADLANLQAQMDPSNATDILGRAADDINSGTLGQRYNASAMMKLGSGVAALDPLKRRAMGLQGFAGGGFINGPVDINSGDDTVIAAKRGEYVIPEEVVRYIGLDKLNKMVEQAKSKMGEANPQEHMMPKDGGYATGGLINISGIKTDAFGDPTQRSLNSLNKIFSVQESLAGNDVDKWRIQDTNTKIMRALQGLPQYATGGLVDPEPDPRTKPLSSLMSKVAPLQMDVPGVPQPERIGLTMNDGRDITPVYDIYSTNPIKGMSLSEPQNNALMNSWGVKPNDQQESPDNVIVDYGGTVGRYGDPTLKARALQNWIDKENAAIRPMSDNPNERASYYNLRASLGRTGSQEEVAGIKADADTRINAEKLRSAFEMNQEKMRNAMEIAGMKGDRDWQIALLRAANSGNSPDSWGQKLDYESAKTLVKQLPKLRSDATQAHNSMTAMEQMLGLLNKGAGGRGGQLRAAVAPYAEMFGYDSKNLSEAQTYELLSKTIGGSMRMAIVGPGQVSNYENQLLQSISAGGKSAPAAARELLKYYKGAAQSKIDDYNNSVNDVSAFSPNTKKMYRLIETSKPVNPGKRNLNPAISYLQGARDKQDAINRIKKLNAKGWTSEELKEAEGGVKWGW